MNARGLLLHLDSLGISVIVDGGRLLVRPGSALTEAHRRALRDAKKEVLALLADLGDSSCLEEFEERAAIMQYDGGLSRSEAEAAALENLRRAQSLRSAGQSSGGVR
jgi:hypothetical protein